MALGTSGRSIFIEIIFGQDVFATQIIVVTIQAFIGFHMGFVREIDGRPAFTRVGLCILNIDFGILGI